MRRPAKVMISVLVLVLISLAVAACAAAGGGDGEDRTDSERPLLLFSIGMHIEPKGARVSDIVTGGAPPRPVPPGDGYDTNEQLYRMHAQDILAVAGIVENHGGSMTIQVQTPFTAMVIDSGDSLLADLAGRGHEIALHFHEDAHLGKDSESLPVETWCAVMAEEVDLIKQASGVDDVRYWSGGNLYPSILQAAACAGLDVYSDWKNPNTQSTPLALTGVNPWRPAGGTDGDDFSSLTSHDPDGAVTYLPEGLFDREDFASVRKSMKADENAYFEYLKDSLLQSLAAARTDQVNVFHFTIHPGEFKGDPADAFAAIDRFLTEVVDPLVESGQIEWATYSQMADAYAQWERENPGVAPK